MPWGELSEDGEGRSELDLSTLMLGEDDLAAGSATLELAKGEATNSEEAGCGERREEMLLFGVSIVLLGEGVAYLDGSSLAAEGLLVG